MSRWFRAYDDSLDDPKVQNLPGELFKAWYNLMCVSSKNNGEPFSTGEVAFRLRLKPAKAQAVVDELILRGLLDDTERGIISHNWDKRQFKSDTSNERVKRHRQQHSNGDCNVTVTPPDTEQIQNRTEKKKDSRSQARPDTSRFEEFWGAYPKRKGHNPKHPSKTLFLAAVKSGVLEDAIIGGARRFAEAERAKINTEFIPQAPKWLRGRGWEDYQPTNPAFRTVAPNSPEWEIERAAKLVRGESVALMDAQAEKGNGWSIKIQQDAAE